MKKMSEDSSFQVIHRYFIEEEGIKTNRIFSDPSMEFHQATTGLVGESREVLTALRNLTSSCEELIDECGDVCFYLTVLIRYLKKISYYSNVDLSIDLLPLASFTRKEGVTQGYVKLKFQEVHELSLDLLEFSKKVFFQQKDFYQVLQKKEYCQKALENIIPTTINAIIHLCHYMNTTPKRILVYNREEKLAKRYGDSFVGGLDV